MDIDLTKYSVNNLKAGDVVKFYYKGELDILETYPGQISLTDEQIVNVELFEANIVSFTVYQVPGGGYDIKTHCSQLTLYDVISAFENTFLVIECMKAGYKCPHNGRMGCCMHREFAGLQCMLRDEFRRNNLEYLFSEQ